MLGQRIVQRQHSLCLEQFEAGNAELAAQVEELLLNLDQQRTHAVWQRLAQQHADVRIELVHVAHGVYPQAVLPPKTDALALDPAIAIQRFSVKECRDAVDDKRLAPHNGWPAEQAGKPQAIEGRLTKPASRARKMPEEKKRSRASALFFEWLPMIYIVSGLIIVIGFRNLIALAAGTALIGAGGIEHLRQKPRASSVRPGTHA